MSCFPWVSEMKSKPRKWRQSISKRLGCSRDSISKYPKDAKVVFDDTSYLGGQSRQPGSTDVKSSTALRIESFPTEIRLEILSNLELKPFRALIEASPVFYNDYRLRQKFLLSDSLYLTLHRVCIDVYAAYESSKESFLSSRSNDSCNKLLKVRKSMGWSPHRSGCSRQYFQSLTAEDLVRISVFHCSVVEPLVKHYTDWAMANYVETTKRELEVQPLRDKERIRLYRAFYRFELGCNMFGRGSSWAYLSPEKPMDYPGTWLSMNLREHFHHRFQPWEIEEIVCIHSFMREKYDRLFQIFTWHWRYNPPSIYSSDAVDEYYNNALYSERYRGQYLNGAISRGLSLLHKCLSNDTNHYQRASILRDQMTKIPTTHLSDQDAMPVDQQWLNECFGPRYRRLKLRERAPMPFAGDGHPKSRKPRLPQTWAVLWDDVYSNLSGSFIPDSLRKWGYIFWDAKRIEQMKAKEVVIQQRDKRWKGRDPRVEYWDSPLLT